MVDTGSGPEPVGYGDLTAQTGTLTGMLGSGDPINNRFYQGGYSAVWRCFIHPCNGTITLEYAPEPSAALLAACALATLVLLRRRARLGQASVLHDDSRW